jgi:signal transduction histidine kinase
MLAVEGLASLAEVVAYEPDSGKALDKLVVGAMKVTGSRNSVLAIANDELGCMELSHGAGSEWTEARYNGFVTVDVASREGIVGHVAATGKPFLTGNVENEPRYRKLFESTKSEIAVPVRDADGRIRAVLNLESDRSDAYTEDQLRACEAIASLISIVLDHEEHLRRERALLMVGRALDHARTEAELLQGVMRVAGEVLRLQACSVFLLDSEGKRFVLRASVGGLKDRVGAISYEPGEGITGWVCQTGESVRLDHPANDPRWRGKYVEFPSEQIAAFLAVPILSRGKCIGAIRVIRRVAGGPQLDNSFTETDEQLLVAIAEQLAAGLENVRGIERQLRSERMAAWGELSAKSSHMIGNRVFALKGDLNELEYQLSKGKPALPTLRELSASLKSNVQRIDEILQDFRDFLTATQLRPETVELGKLIRETVREVIPKRAGVKLKVTLDPGIPKLMLDSRRVRRALSELLENALIWDEGGAVEVSAGPAVPEHLRRAKLAARDGFVEVVVSDSGPGVPEERKTEIFEPFHSGKVKGMGLGLSIVKGIVEAHGGAALEVGLPGRGARFVMLFPVSDRRKGESK